MNINELTEEEKLQYAKIFGPAISTNNIARNCYGILFNACMVNVNELNQQVSQKLATAMDCLKNCCDLNDLTISNAAKQYFENAVKKEEKKEETEEKPVVCDECCTKETNEEDKQDD